MKQLNVTTTHSVFSPEQGSLRSISLVAGIIYLITFISIPTLSLYGPIHGAQYVSGSSDMGVLIGTVLELIVGLGGIGTAVVLYPVLKRQNESAAIGLVASRVLEAATIFAGVSFMLDAVALSQSGVDESVSRTTLVAMYDKMFLVGQGVMPAVNDLLLGFLFYQSRLIPRVLSLIGIVGGFVLIGGDVGVLFGVLDQREPVTILAAMPVALFEFSLGIWLVLKGFKHIPTT